MSSAANLLGPLRVNIINFIYHNTHPHLTACWEGGYTFFHFFMSICHMSVRPFGSLLKVSNKHCILSVSCCCFFLQDTVSKIMVMVETPVSGITINCPAEMATYEPDICTVDVIAGTDMQVDITYNDGATSISRNFIIAGKNNV